MSELNKADQYLLDRIRRGEPDGWSQLVDRYQGRLIAFARKRLGNAADAEDLIQDTFVAFLNGLDRYRAEAGLETYLFTIARRKIIDQFRGRKMNVCLIQDAFSGGADDSPGDPWGRLAGPDLTASTYARQDEQADLQEDALADALRKLVAGYRESLSFRELKVIELLFYCQVRNKEIARLTGVNEKQVALIKHRCLGRIRRDLGLADDSPAASDALLTVAWERLRPSCPKRNTIGAYLLGSLDDEWAEYVRFHIEQLGCRFCLANYEDLQRQTADTERQAVRQRILESTVGFLPTRP